MPLAKAFSPAPTLLWIQMPLMALALLAPIIDDGATGGIWPWSSTNESAHEVNRVPSW
ncbi:hypothetical protein GQ53DRAFT_745286 [Thozetella sp. PMI_491]|nr:hypothetical protein GQ53DRAFT_745286 [Thozetella sp. PMI_491]